MTEHIERIEQNIVAPDASHQRATGLRLLSYGLREDLPRGWRAWATVAVFAAAVLAFGVSGGLVAAGLCALALVALGVAAVRPALIGPFVVLLLPAGQAAHILGAQVSPLEAAVGGSAIGYLVGMVSRHERPRLALADWLFVALLVAMAISMLGPVDTSNRAREIVFWGALFVVFYALRSELRATRASTPLLVGLGIATIVGASAALYEYLDRWPDRSSSLQGAIVYPLPQGTFGHPNALAIFLVLAVLAVLGLALSQSQALKWAGFAIAGIGSLALVVTFSRASWIAFFAGVLVYLIDRRTRVAAVAFTGLAFAGGAAMALLQGGAIGARVGSVFTSEASDLYGFRLELISRAARLAAEHPITGAGSFDAIGVYAGRLDEATHPHNLLFGVAVFFGFPAALVFSALLLVALRTAWTAYRSGSRQPTDLTALGFVAALLAFLVNGILEYALWNTSLIVLVILVIAVASSFRMNSESDGAQPTGQGPNGLVAAE